MLPYFPSLFLQILGVRGTFPEYYLGDGGLIPPLILPLTNSIEIRHNIYSHSAVKGCKLNFWRKNFVVFNLIEGQKGGGIPPSQPVLIGLIDIRHICIYSALVELYL